MSENAELSTLSDRMRYAASVLHEATMREAREGCFEISSWTPESLRDRATQWRREDNQRREQLIEDLANALAPIIWIPHAFEKLSEQNRRFCRVQARKLIELGWRKGDPA